MRTKGELFDDILQAWLRAKLIDIVKYHNDPIYHAYLHHLINSAVEAVYSEIDAAYYRGRSVGGRV